MYDEVLGYDIESPSSIEEFAKGLREKTFREICKLDAQLNGESDDSGEKKGNKGRLGQLVEERYFHYRCNNNPTPDFEEAGVELKVSPFLENKKGQITAKERLVISLIDYCKVVEESFANSHMWKKAQKILLVYYLYRKEIEDKLDYKIRFTGLFTPPEEDLKIIRQDFETIKTKIRIGKAHELSGRDTLYLEAAPKGTKTSKNRKQPFSDVLAKPRAFAFKASYMTCVLNKYFVGGKQIETIVNGPFEGTFEDHVLKRLSGYIGKSMDELLEEYAISRKAKQYGALLAYRMLGIRGNSAEEFVKANVVVKTVRLLKKGKPKESMSFPLIRFDKLIKEEWDESTFGNYLRNTRFLFMIYREDKRGVPTFRGGQFWSMPYEDLEIDVKTVWEKTRDLVREGLEIRIEQGKYRTNLPKLKDNRVSHVRPHADDSKDTCVLPDGRVIPKQCFWLNRLYVWSQLNKEFTD